MRFILTILIALAAFAGGVWYANEYDFTLPFIGSSMTAPTPVPQSQGSATTTPQPQATYSNASADRIVVDMPKPGDVVPATFAVIGKARGGWYFEASFPLNVLSNAGSLLKEMPVQADGDWMTPEFVPFSEMVTLPAGYKGAATLVLKNDNPSGLPEHDASISIPIVIQ